MTQKKFYFGRGKLLLTSEYFILDGAKALALPTKLGQQMEVSYLDFKGASILNWEALNEKGEVWFWGQFSPDRFHIIETSNKDTAVALQTILRSVPNTNEFVPKNKVTKVGTELDFPTNWGLGSSSTLVAMIAQWAGMNPFDLLKETFGGSGYDIACAGVESPILYQLKDKEPHWEQVDFAPSFKDQIYFVFLEKKQNSRKGIKHYRERMSAPQKWIEELNTLTDTILHASSLTDFEKALEEHEDIISKSLHLEKVKDLHFEDYQGGIVKSLGAWGGDFVLVTSNLSPKETHDYFNDKGFGVVLPYENLIV